MRVLVDAAIAGTARRAPGPETFASPGAALVPADLAPERRLLLAAGAEAVRAAAGAVAAPAGTALDPCPDDATPELDRASADVLLAVAGSGTPELLREAAELVAAAGRRIPAEVLPAWLRAVERHGAEVPLPDTLGTRGRWLASLRPAWSALVARDAGPLPDDERTWLEGKGADRVAALVRRRRAEPDRGRAWVEATFAKERAADRAQFVGALLVGLAPGDEPFLESCLDDRSAEVRAAARTALARLPGSAWVRRMTERADGVVRVESGRIAPQIPEETPPEWRRDLPDASRDAPGGAKAKLLAALVGAVPPEHWERRFRAPPAKLVPVVRKSEWRDAILGGWCSATLVHGAAAWAVALHDEYAGAGVAAPDWGWRAHLLRLVPPADAEPRLLALFDERLRDADRFEMTPLGVLPSPWSESFAAAWTDRLRKLWDPADRWPARFGLSVAATALRPSALPAALAILDARRPDGGDEPAVARSFRETADLRLRIHREIRR